MSKKQKNEKSRFTAQMNLFCEHYVQLMDGKAAAIKAGYSQKTAVNQASRLLTNVNVKNRIKELNKDVSNTCKVNKVKQVNFFLQQQNDETKEDLIRQSAGKEVNKLLGLYEPDKIDIESPNGSMSPKTTVEFINARKKE